MRRTQRAQLATGLANGRPGGPPGGSPHCLAEDSMPGFCQRRADPKQRGERPGERGHPKEAPGRRVLQAIMGAPVSSMMPPLSLVKTDSVPVPSASPAMSPTTRPSRKGTASLP